MNYIKKPSKMTEKNHSKIDVVEIRFICIFKFKSLRKLFKYKIQFIKG